MDYKTWKEIINKMKADGINIKTTNLNDPKVKKYFKKKQHGGKVISDSHKLMNSIYK